MSINDPGDGREGPIRLRDMGSFHTAGRSVSLSGLPVRELVLAEGGTPVRSNPNGHSIVEQMYAQYFLPEQPNGRGPLVFWHGGGMTGKTWETTPDGRPGWLNYFLRRGWDCYLCDAVERGRSGFAPVPQVWMEAPVIQTADDVYVRFRIGNGAGSYHADPSSRQPYGNTQFPAQGFDNLVRQLVPRWTSTDAAIFCAYLQLLERTGQATLICHSQGGVFGLRAAYERPDLVRALVALEPASVPAMDKSATAYQTPTLFVMGDNMDTDARWPAMRARIEAFAQSHASAQMLSLPKLGLTGNSHVLMMDANHYEIADHVQAWLEQTSTMR
jgi:pimeloyl-ACP methyl ester carboxylesterase